MVNISSVCYSASICPSPGHQTQTPTKNGSHAPSAHCFSFPQLQGGARDLNLCRLAHMLLGHWIGTAEPLQGIESFPGISGQETCSYLLDVKQRDANCRLVGVFLLP